MVQVTYCLDISALLHREVEDRQSLAALAELRTRSRATGETKVAEVCGAENDTW